MEHYQISELHEHKHDLLLPSCFGREMSSLVRSNAVQNTMMMDKVFCKSLGDSLGRSIMYMKCKPVTRI